jgi:hypothetical protein
MVDASRRMPVDEEQAQAVIRRTRDLRRTAEETCEAAKHARREWNEFHTIDPRGLKGK